MVEETLELPKIGFVEPKFKKDVGSLYLADIGVPASLYTQLGLDHQTLFINKSGIRI